MSGPKGHSPFLVFDGEAGSCTNPAFCELAVADFGLILLPLMKRVLFLIIIAAVCGTGCVHYESSPMMRNETGEPQPPLLTASVEKR